MTPSPSAFRSQVNSVSSLIEDPVVSQTKIDEEKAERDLEHRLRGREIFRGGKPDRTPSDLRGTGTRKSKTPSSRVSHNAPRDVFSWDGN